MSQPPSPPQGASGERRGRPPWEPSEPPPGLDQPAPDPDQALSAADGGDPPGRPSWQPSERPPSRGEPPWQAAPPPPPAPTSLPAPPHAPTPQSLSAADRDRGRNEPPWGPPPTPTPPPPTPPPSAPHPSAPHPSAPHPSAPPLSGPGLASGQGPAPFLREVRPPARRPGPGAGDLTRRQGTFTGRITRDGSSGFPVEAGRYQLYASLACPWSQRALIVCRLLGLDRVIGLTLTDPVTDENGSRLGDHDPGDPLTGARYLADLYRATDPGYPGPYTLPLIWDQRTRTVVTNDVADITVMLETEFRQYHRPGSPDLYPLTRRRDIESLATLIYHTVNYGVYRAGQATDQASYEQAVDALFTTFDALEERLAGRRFLLGAQLTETDIRLYPTLARFDAVYYQLFNCNLRRLTDYPHLWGYARDLYSQPGFGETTDLSQIKRHYYLSAEWDNRSQIIPIGPLINWNEPHGRARLSA